MHANHYGRLAIMAALSFVAMYALMYAMVDRFANVHPNLNQLYMAALITAPMVILDLVLMGAMDRDARANRVIIIVSAIAVGSFVLIR